MIDASLFAFFALLAAACFACYQGGRWRERARAAEKRAALNDGARAVREDVAFDPALRERVRRRFDRP